MLVRSTSARRRRRTYFDLVVKAMERRDMRAKAYRENQEIMATDALGNAHADRQPPHSDYLNRDKKKLAAGAAASYAFTLGNLRGCCPTAMSRGCGKP